jgi:hypothetical protein
MKVFLNVSISLFNDFSIFANVLHQKNDPLFFAYIDLSDHGSLTGEESSLNKPTVGKIQDVINYEKSS